MDITLALINADIDINRISTNPLGETRIDLDSGHIITAPEPMDDDTNADWWTATRYDTDGGEALIYEGTDLDALVRTLAAA